MNKKFLSAILFGALMVTSTGTFVSCKDYDDDIENLQTQIDKNSSAIAELQKLVGQGKWVSSISSIENGFTVTMSDGSSHQIKGINGKDGSDGKDGKNGTEWTIGEDGFWYVDGEKTENVAVAKDGKNGVTAPSPSIGADGNWIVYNWDEAKGEFVAEATEIPAAGTAAYAVEANGVYTLYIADADGEMQEIALPATSDSFVATSPAALVEVLHQEAKWTKVTGEDKKLFAKLAAAFPEIEEYEKDDLMKQGGNLPVIISPANLELTDEFKFSLQSLKGEVSEAVLSNPVKGMPEAEIWMEGLGLITRSADKDACLWTLNVEPAKNKKGTAYVNIDEPHTLVVENAKGTVVKTAFAYYVTSEEVGNVAVKYNAKGETIAYNDGIDVLAKAYELDDVEGKDAIFTITNGMNGKYILEVDKLDAEKYGVVVNGSKLTINNMPTDKTTVKIKVNLIALGLNGTVKESTYKTLTIGQVIAATGTLEDVTVTLNGTESKNKVRWNIEDLEFTALQLNEFMEADSKKLEVSYINDDDEKVVVQNTEISVYKKNGTTLATNYEDASIFGINLNASDYKPGNYDLRLVVSNGTGKKETIIYVAEGTLTVENPTTAVIKLAAAHVDENGVLQVTGYPGSTFVTYDLTNAFVYKTSEVSNLTFEDLDADDESNWISNNVLSVNKYDYEDEEKQDLYKVRNFKVTYALFGNPDNTEEMEFQAQVISEIYAEDPSTVISLTAARLTTAFGAKNNDKTDDIDESLIDFTQITKAVYAAGMNAGKEYNLWAKDGSAATTKDVKVNDYSKVAKFDAPTDYALTAAGKPIKIAEDDLMDFGMPLEVYLKRAEQANPSSIYLTLNDQEITWSGGSFTIMGWNTIMSTLTTNYYGWINKTSAYKFGYYGPGKEADLNQNVKTAKALFDAYKGNLVFEEMLLTVPVDAKDPVLAADGKVTSVVINFVDEEEGKKYATISNNQLTAVSNKPVDVVGDQVIVPMFIEITDAWGMVMKHEFNVTIKTVQ